MSEHDNDQIITDFCDAWTNNDVDAIIGAFADDAVYHNIPMDPTVGKDNIAAGIGGFLAAGTIEFITHHQVTNGNLVMNERTDIVRLPGAEPREIRVMGVFELADGKIVAWRDYFDLKEFTG